MSKLTRRGALAGLLALAGCAQGRSLVTGESNPYTIPLSGEAEFKKLQSALKDAGYYTGPIDGDFGNGSKAALNAFFEKNSVEMLRQAGPGYADYNEGITQGVLQDVEQAARGDGLFYKADELTIGDRIQGGAEGFVDGLKGGPKPSQP